MPKKRPALGGEATLVIKSERGLARKVAPFKSHSLLIRICYARYADDLLWIFILPNKSIKILFFMGKLEININEDKSMGLGSLMVGVIP